MWMLKRIKNLFCLVLGVICLPALTQEAFIAPHAIQFEPVLSEGSRGHDYLHSEQFKTEAQHWKLSLAEYQRYHELLQHDWVKNWWKELDPPHVLGLMALTPTEIQKYAEIDVQLDVARTQRELDFQQAYDQAFKKYYPNFQPIGQ